jgi:hypothetical protein
MSAPQIYECPYGCGVKFSQAHWQCRGATEPLPIKQQIKFECGKFGDLPNPPAFDRTGRTQCKLCFGWYKMHLKCSVQGQRVPKITVNEKLTSNTTLSDDLKINYGRIKSKPYASASVSASASASASTSASTTRKWQSPIIYWIGPLEIQSTGKTIVFANSSELAAYLMATCKYMQVLLSVNKEWWSDLNQALCQQKGISYKPKVSLQVYGKFKCRSTGDWDFEKLEDFDKVDAYIYRVFGMELRNKLTIRQLVYDYWYQTSQKGKGEAEKCLPLTDPKDYIFAKSAYYGGREEAVLGEYRSSLAEIIEQDTQAGNQIRYMELLEAPEADLKMNLDMNQSYPAVMTGFKNFETYYPIGPHRNSNEGAIEFAKGTVGLYSVRYTRPEGLPMAILPKRSKKIHWDKTPGTDVGNYTDVELKLAIEYGYQIEFTGPCILWDRIGHPFDEVLTTIRTAEANETDDACRNILKKMRNSLYGKMAQKVKGSLKMKEITAEEALERLMRGIDTHWEGGKFLISANDGKPFKNNRPNHLGAYILSWQRKRMMEFFKVINYEYERIKTDSIRVSFANYRKLVAAGFVDAKKIGKFKVEQMIYSCQQTKEGIKLVVKFLKPDGTLDTKVIGKPTKKQLAAADESASSEDDEFASSDDDEFAEE